MICFIELYSKHSLQIQAQIADYLINHGLLAFG